MNWIKRKSPKNDDRVVRWVTTTGTTGDNEWSSKWQPVTISDNQWQRMTASDKTNE